jgi:competence protein ComEC
MVSLAPLLLAACLPLALSPAPEAERGLSITFVDVEGGAATLLVTPGGESVLIDSGFPGERDAARIEKAMADAGLTRIDHFIVTHWHIDHVGGIGPLSEKVPVAHHYHRGLPPAPKDGGTDLKLVEVYQKVSGGKARVLIPGEEVPLRPSAGLPLSLRCLVARSRVEGEAAESGAPPVGAPPVGAPPVGAPPVSATPISEPRACTLHPAQPADTTDNVKSLGFLLRYGEFRFLDLGDLTWNIEHALVCPKNLIGKVDVYQVTHHGNDSSNNPALLKAVSPRVAVVNNGPRKGGSKRVFTSLKSMEGLEAVFQLHRNVETGDDANAPAEFIANQAESCSGEPVSVTVAPDSKSYTVLVGRSGLKRTFKTR